MAPKGFDETAEAKGLKPDTITCLKEQEYDTALAVATLTLDQIDQMKISPAQKGLLRVWVSELNTKSKKPASAPAAAASKAQSSIEDIRKDQALSEEVTRRLQKLGLIEETSDDDEQLPTLSGKKQSSGRNKTVADLVKKSVSWPHFYIFRGLNRTPAAYDDLTVQELVFGTLSYIKESKSDMKDAIQEHLRSIMADAMEYPWPLVRSYHGVLLQLIEQGRFSWGQSTQEIREQYLRSPTLYQPPHQQPHAQYSVTGAVQYCAPFQSGSCSEAGPQHMSQRGLVHHVCAFCLKKAGKSCAHPESACKRKLHSRDN